MKIFAYLLIIGGILGFVVTDIFIENSIAKIPIEQKMFETLKGREAILSYLEARDTFLGIQIVTNRLFVILFVSGTALLLLRRIKKVEKKLDKILEFGTF